LAMTYDNVYLILAGGDGDATESLRSQVKEKGLQGRVRFTGEYDHGSLLEIEQSADIFLFPSLNEGMSNSMLEAMASGLPIVMTPTGGAEELVEDGKNGFLVDFRSARDIKKKLDILIKDAELRKRMGQESRRIAESLSWEKVARSYTEMYHEVKKQS